MSRRWPPPLAPGARVALLAPAGPLAGDGVADVERAVRNARQLGWEPVVGAHARERWGYLAGTDTVRLADLNDALRSPDVDAVWFLRGGYGTMRLLAGVDYEVLRRRPIPLIGYSDITALHAAAGRMAGVVTFHGPVARAPLPGPAARSLHAAVAARAQPAGVAVGTRAIRPGTAEGVLAGGNLALLAALAGTPYAPDLRGAILVLEDVNEDVYRVDRMLQQLLLARMLDGVRGIAFGQLTDPPSSVAGGGQTLDDVLSRLADTLHVPCMAGLPVGHVDWQWTLPLGALAVLDVEGARLDVQMRATDMAGHGHGVARMDHNHDHRQVPEARMAYKSCSDLVNEAKQRIREVTPRQVQEMQDTKADVLYLDVREPNEWNLGHVPGAIHIPRGILESRVEQVVPRDREVVIYCAGGNRSALAADTMQQMGYERVSSMSGGWRDWVGSGGPVEG